MTLKEAMESGKRFKRKNDLNWRDMNAGTICITQEDFNAYDWELEKTPRHFTLYISPDGEQVKFGNAPIEWDRVEAMEIL